MGKVIDVIYGKALYKLEVSQKNIEGKSKKNKDNLTAPVKEGMLFQGSYEGISR